MNPKGEQLYLKPDEAKFISMAVVAMIEQLRDTSKNELINWNPDARKDLKEMLTAGNNLSVKLQKLGFDMRELPPYLDGDENEFLTKQS
jgi:hypothetical protein